MFDRGDAWTFTIPRAKGLEEGSGTGDGTLASPMPGMIVAVSVAEGDLVRKGQSLVVLEAMKMEHALTAPFDGHVASLAARVGDQVAEGVTLVTLARES